VLILWATCRCTVHRRALPTRVNLRRNEPLRRRCLQRAPFACLRCGATAGMLLAAIRPEVTGDLVPARSCLPDGISSSSRLLVGSLPVSSQRLACRSNSAHGSPSGGTTVEREESWPGTVTPLWTVPVALSTASLQPAVLCKRAPGPCRSGSRTHSDQIEDQRALAAPTRVSPTATTEQKQHHNNDQ
jgi:hypothetical protein